MVLVRRARKSREFDGQPQERIFREHAAYTIGLGAEGQVLAVGPVTHSKAGQEAARFGSYPQGPHQKARQLLANDPCLVQGQYPFGNMTWLTRKGGTTFPRTRGRGREAR